MNAFDTDPGGVSSCKEIRHFSAGPSPAASVAGFLSAEPSMNPLMGVTLQRERLIISPLGVFTLPGSGAVLSIAGAEQSWAEFSNRPGR
jgi:hypothetical protein